MQFHISAHHTPDNCGVHRNPDNPDGSPAATVTDWPGRCKEVGVEFIKGGGLPSFSPAFYVRRNGRLRQIEGFDATSDGVLGYRNIRCHRFVANNQVEEYQAKVLGVSNRTEDSGVFG